MLNLCANLGIYQQLECDAIKKTKIISAEREKNQA